MRDLPQNLAPIQNQAQEIFDQVRLLIGECPLAAELINQSQEWAIHIVENLPAAPATALAAATISTAEFKNGHPIDTAKLLTAQGLAIYGLEKSMFQASIAGRKMVKKYIDGEKLEALQEAAHGVFLGVVSAADGVIILRALQSESVNVAVNSLADFVGIPDMNVIAKAAILGGIATQLFFIAGATWQGYQEGAFSPARDHAYMLGREICTRAHQLITSRSQQVLPQQDEMHGGLELEAAFPSTNPQVRIEENDELNTNVSGTVFRKPQSLQPTRDPNSNSQGV